MAIVFPFEFPFWVMQAQMTAEKKRSLSPLAAAWKESKFVHEDMKRRTSNRWRLHRCEATLKGCPVARLRVEDQSGRCEEIGIYAHRKRPKV